MRVEPVASQENKVPFGQIIHLSLHESNLFFCYGYLWHVAKLLVQQFSKALGINRTVAVEKGIFHFCPRIGLKNIILTTERICVVVGQMPDDLLHEFCRL